MQSLCRYIVCVFTFEFHYSSREFHKKTSMYFQKYLGYKPWNLRWIKVGKCYFMPTLTPLCSWVRGGETTWNSWDTFWIGSCFLRVDFFFFKWIQDDLFSCKQLVPTRDSNEWDAKTNDVSWFFLKIHPMIFVGVLGV